MRTRTPASAAAEIESAEDRFFAALSTGDGDGVEEHLDDRFVIVDVTSGTVIERASFVQALREKAVVFDRLELVERATRVYGDTGIVVGRTAMAGSIAGDPFEVASRYTHVFVNGDAGWRLANGQGTSIAEP